MTKKPGILLEIALVLLFTIALSTSNSLSTSTDVIIYAFDQNPAGSDESNEWVALYKIPQMKVWILETGF